MIINTFYVQKIINTFYVQNIFDQCAQKLLRDLIGVSIQMNIQVIFP